MGNRVLRENIDKISHKVDGGRGMLTYQSRGDAKRAKRRTQAVGYKGKDGQSLQTYWCDSCKGYHVGHSLKGSALPRART